MALALKFSQNFGKNLSKANKIVQKGSILHGNKLNFLNVILVSGWRHQLRFTRLGRGQTVRKFVLANWSKNSFGAKTVRKSNKIGRLPVPRNSRCNLSELCVRFWTCRQCSAATSRKWTAVLENYFLNCSFSHQILFNSIFGIKVLFLFISILTETSTSKWFNFWGRF